MARTPDLQLKQDLLDQVVRYLAVHGMGDVSLRPLAKALGTSPNRLVHHFGSKEELLVAPLARATELQEDVRAHGSEERELEFLVTLCLCGD